MTIFDQLERDEGNRLKPYTDTIGKLTIGVGRNLTDKGITESEAQQMLADDVAEVQASLAANGFPLSDDPRYWVLVNMAFNMGVHGLLQFHNTLSLYRTGDFAGCAVAMLDSQWAKQVGDRAERLAKQMETGEWV